MRLIKPYYEILTQIDGDYILKLLELAGRTCYASHDKITEESSTRFCKNILNRNHESVIEHFGITVKIICDRGISHEICRHRIMSISQQSTRYVKYNSNPDDDNKYITFIKPLWIDIPEGIYNFEDININIQEPDKTWLRHMLGCENHYNFLLAYGWKPEQARSVLPNALKTELVLTANLREWRHIFKLRTAHAAHPQMREIMMPLCLEFQSKIPIIFDDIQL